MTVQELIEALQKQDQDAALFVHDGHMTEFKIVDVRKSSVAGEVHLCLLPTR